jgi:hypothetical protein
MIVNAVIHDTLPYDQNHTSRLVISLAAPQPEGELNAPALARVPSCLGTDRCDTGATYATDLVLEVSALARHRIDHVVSSVHEAELATNRVTIRIPEVRMSGRLQVVLAVTVKAQRQALPRPVSVFAVKLAYDRVGPEGRRERGGAEAKARVRFAKPDKPGT